MKYRTQGPDVMPPPVKTPKDPPGTFPKHHTPIYDHKGRLRGRVGNLASSITVARFTGQHGSKLGKKDGRTAWISPPPPPPPKPQIDPTAVAVAKATPQPKPSNESHKVEISVKQAMGSASKKKPDKPDTRARPKRG